MQSELFNGDILLLDGAMGTMLQKSGLPVGGQPELLCLTDGEKIRNIHRQYLEAGSRVVYTNTFGANRRKLKRSGHSVEEVVSRAVALAKEACDGTGARVALDIGPIGVLLEPMGLMTFEEAYDIFREMVLAGSHAGADLIVIETMTDLAETRAALLAAKENTALPVFVTMTFEKNGRTFTGCTLSSMACVLEGLGADAIGINCSLGPADMAPFVRQLARCTSLPLIVKPNAGLPDPVDGHYDVPPEAFAEQLLPCLEAGAAIFGGCCGTTPDYIAALRKTLAGRRPAARTAPQTSLICTPSMPLTLSGVHVVGERINPTGKKRFQQALLEDDLDYILDVAIRQMDAGAEILDVNVGYPGVNEAEMMPRVVKKLQSAVPLPLQLDSSDPAALEAGLRVLCGKGIVNSVNGDAQTLEAILPVVKKYGAAVIGLTLDSGGIPETAEQRLAIARRILQAAERAGIPRGDVIIDCLTLTVSAQQSQAAETLRALRLVREELGLNTALGVSNISFGLPNRELMTENFLTQALACGLTLPIVNPNQKSMMDAVAAFRVLSGEDEGAAAYIARFAGQTPASAAPAATDGALSLEEAVLRGHKSEARRAARELLGSESELAIIDKRLIPALDRVGELYETGVYFLPQLMSAAAAACEAFEVLRAALAEKGVSANKGTIVIATVKGDIHDIGKNIVRTVLENYGYRVVDLGRDVPPERVVETAIREQARLVGLSALMTTTLPSMQATIEALHASGHKCTIFVGGAVLTEQYAKTIGADYYARDAKQAVEIAKLVLSPAAE